MNRQVKFLGKLKKYIYILFFFLGGGGGGQVGGGVTGWM